MSDQDTPSTGPSTLADAAALGLQSPSGGTPRTSPYATIERCPECLPPPERVSKDKIYSLVRAGKIPVYRLPGVKPACVKIEEVRAVLASLSAQGKLRLGYGSFGPSAVVRDLSKVAGQEFEVLQ